MKITYLSCDGVSEITEEITKIEFCVYKIDGETEVELECLRSPENKYFDKTAQGRFANMFSVSAEKVYLIEK